jgi:hypothetical protein
VAKGTSTADKTGGHRSRSVDGKSAGLKTPSYSAAPVAPQAPPAQGLGIAGQKALIIRAKKTLGALEDPNQALTN